MNENKAEQDERVGGSRRLELFYAGQGDLVTFDELTFEKRPEENKEVSHKAMWRKCIPGRGNSKCKRPGGESLI